ncbi:hypothetical protein Tco_1255341 [Tanacetum coccineum]
MELKLSVLRVVPIGWPLHKLTSGLLSISLEQLQSIPTLVDDPIFLARDIPGTGSNISGCYSPSSPKNNS